VTFNYPMPVEDAPSLSSTQHSALQLQGL